jgi:hypothetical protein
LGNPVIGINNKHYAGNLIQGSISEGVFDISFPAINLMCGDYLVDVYLGNEHHDFEILKECFVLKVDMESNSKALEFPKIELNKIYYKDVSWRLTAR